MNNKHKNWLSILLLSLSAGLLAAWLVRRQAHRDQPSPLPLWQRLLAQKHGVDRAQAFAHDIRKAYAQLLAECAAPANATLRWHLTENILPGLALYRVLLADHGGDRQAALAEIDPIFGAWTQNKTRALLAPFQILPLPFWLFRKLAALQMKRYPPEGWDFSPVEDSPTRLAFNATRCFYLNTLTALGAPELTPAFCKTDEVMAEGFPATVRFVRSHTLGRGDALCDFQYCYEAACKQDVLEVQNS